MLGVYVEPSGPPIGLKEVGADITSLSVSWRQPTVTDRNGAIIKYTVYWKEAKSSGPFETIEVTGHQVGIFNLSGNTAYLFSVSAWTSFGEGPASGNMTAITHQGRKSMKEMRRR